MTLRRILFVCTGNTGRSPAAEALARRGIAARGLSLTVASRGLAVNRHDGRAEPHVVALLAARGIDLSTHRATALAEPDVGTADLILTMTASHQKAVQARFPEATHKVRMLSQAARDMQLDIPDAFGAPIATYERLVAQLDGLVADLLNKLAMA